MKVSILFCLFAANSYAKTLTVVLLDSGLDISDSRLSGSLCPRGHRDFSGEGLQDDIGHSTHVLGLIEQNAPQTGWCAIIVKYIRKHGHNNMQSYHKAMQYILKLRPDYVNMSGGGPNFEESEYLVIKTLTHTKFIVAAGNEGQNISKPENYYFPANYNLPNITVVENIDKSGKLVKSSNFGLRGARREVGFKVLSKVPCKLRSVFIPGCHDYMTGTSQATAITTGKIIKEDIDKNILSR